MAGVILSMLSLHWCSILEQLCLLDCTAAILRQDAVLGSANTFEQPLQLTRFTDT